MPEKLIRIFLFPTAADTLSRFPFAFLLSGLVRLGAHTYTARGVLLPSISSAPRGMRKFCAAVDTVPRRTNKRGERSLACHIALTSPLRLIRFTFRLFLCAALFFPHDNSGSHFPRRVFSFSFFSLIATVLRFILIRRMHPLV